MKKNIINMLANVLTDILPADQIDTLLEIPPSEDMGDFALPCFSLAKKFRKSPALIADELKTKIEGQKGITHVKSVSGYLNIFVDKQILARQILDTALSDDFGKANDKRKVVLEFLSPNSNKPLHLGHLRNIAIGKSLSNILSFNGNKVTKVSINNDRGIHICKSMLAYQKFGNGQTPESVNQKSDHFVGDYYVIYNQKVKEDESLADEAQNMLLQWEASDEKVIELWKKMNDWAFKGFEETYRLFNVSFDKEYFESQIYMHGKEIVNEGYEKGVFTKRENGTIGIDLEKEKLGEKVLLRADGTSVYIVQDLYLAKLKYDEFNYDLSIYVVGNEQEYHFQVLKAILGKLGNEQAEKIFHLSYGMVELPEGKMKSREGTVVDADDLIHETREFARTEIEKRYQLPQEELDVRSLKIALAAITYQLLKVDTGKNMLFNPKEAIKFEGDTGPYLLYSYARSSSILRKVEEDPSDCEIPELNEYEIKFIKKLSQFPEAVEQAYTRFAPSSLATYGCELAQMFNEFYHHCPVIKSEHKDFRVMLVKAFNTTLKKCLNLLGIDEIEEM